ncbi:MAG TPA: TonB family protein, partial [Rhizomicrobium sp.]|nr:TonB family protein [Rhizomicrobium sp.]
MPQFMVQPDNTATRATLAATMAPPPSPLTGGARNPDAPGPPISAAGSDGNAGATAGCLDADWVRAFDARLLWAFHYPRIAEMLGITGEVRLRFTVQSDGYFSTLKMDKASGSVTLDSGAISMMRRA